MKKYLFFYVLVEIIQKNFELLIPISEELNTYAKKKYKILIVGKDVKLLKELINKKGLEENFILIDEIDNEISSKLYISEY